MQGQLGGKDVKGNPHGVAYQTNQTPKSVDDIRHKQGLDGNGCQEDEFICTSCVPDNVLGLTIGVFTLAPTSAAGWASPMPFPEKLEHLTQEQAPDEKLSSLPPEPRPQSHALPLSVGTPGKGLTVTSLRFYWWSCPHYHFPGKPSPTLSVCGYFSLWEPQWPM